jgi:hypothetical protein
MNEAMGKGDMSRASVLVEEARGKFARARVLVEEARGKFEHGGASTELCKEVCAVVNHLDQADSILKHKVQAQQERIKDFELGQQQLAMARRVLEAGEEGGGGISQAKALLHEAKQTFVRAKKHKSREVVMQVQRLEADIASGP